MNRESRDEDEFDESTIGFEGGMFDGLIVANG